MVLCSVRELSFQFCSQFLLFQNTFQFLVDPASPDIVVLNLRWCVEHHGRIDHGAKHQIDFPAGSDFGLDLALLRGVVLGPVVVDVLQFQVDGPGLVFHGLFGDVEPVDHVGLHQSAFLVLEELVLELGLAAQGALEKAVVNTNIGRVNESARKKPIVFL